MGVLLRAGADINQRNLAGFTALHQAARRGAYVTGTTATLPRIFCWTEVLDDSWRGGFAAFHHFIVRDSVPVTVSCQGGGVRSLTPLSQISKQALTGSSLFVTARQIIRNFPLLLSNCQSKPLLGSMVGNESCGDFFGESWNPESGFKLLKYLQIAT